MSVHSILAQSRTRSESRMTETITAGPYKSATDPDTGDASYTLIETVYDGKGRIKYVSLAVSDSEETSQSVAEQTPMLSIPTGSPPLHEGIGVKVTASTVDGLLIDRFYKIEGAPQSGQTSSHRYPLSELS